MVSLRGGNNMFAEVCTPPPKNYGLNFNLLKSYVQALAYKLLFHLICRREQPHWSGLKECGNGPRNQVRHQNNPNQPTLLLCPSYVHKSHLCPSIHLLLVLKNMYTRCTMCTSSTPSKFFEVIASPAFQFKCWNAGNLGPDDILVSTHVDEIMSRWHF